jgi:cytohesin
MTTKPSALKGPTTDLHRAAAVGDLEAVRGQLAAGHPPDPRDPEGYTPFLLSCRHAEPDVFHALLDAGADFEATNVRGMSGLFVVATTGVVSLARVLIDRGADVNRQAARGLTPLIAAVMSENAHLVRLLVGAGADVRHTDRDGTSVLRWARKIGTKEMVEVIRHPDRAVNGPAGPVTSADLHRGAATGDVELIGECLAAGVPIEQPDEDGFTPLMLAARQGKRAAIAALLEAGADPYRPTASGFTAVLLACNNPTALRPFVAAGVDLDRPVPRRGITPLIYAARQGFDDVVRFLVESGVDRARTDPDGLTAEDHAAANGHRRIAQTLRSPAQ